MQLKAATINHLHAKVRALLFGCTDTNIFDLGVRIIMVLVGLETTIELHDLANYLGLESTLHRRKASQSLTATPTLEI